MNEVVENILVTSGKEELEMQKQDILKRKSPVNKIFTRGAVPVATHWVRIPATSHFDISLSNHVTLLKAVGIYRRLHNKKHFGKHSNEAMNRYMSYQCTRLEGYLSKGEVRKFWYVAHILMRSSVSFRVSAINRVFHNWYKLYPLSMILNINRKCSKIIKSWDDDLKFKRVYLDQGDKLRPLGVPTPSWRLVLHMWSNFLGQFLRGKLGESQHAYQPLRGTLSAWKELSKNLKEWDFVYEIDLKQCFPSINAAWITEKLEGFGMPPRMFYYLENLNRCVPILPKEELLNESDVHEKASFKDLANSPPDSLFKSFNEMEPENQKVVLQLAALEGMTLFEFIQMQWVLLDQYHHASVGASHAGTPQGANTSPLLTCMALKEFTEQRKSVFYADDGIFFSNEDFEVRGDENKGIIINREKSHWIRREGKWLRKIKFLGLEYDPWNDSLRGNTRSGSVLEFSGTTERVWDLLPKLTRMYQNRWATLFNGTSLGGTITSQIYNNTWEKLVYEWNRDAQAKGKRSSWLGQRKWFDNFRTTSSCACGSLRDILSSDCGASKKKIVKLDKGSKPDIRRKAKIAGRWITLKPKLKSGQPKVLLA